MNNIIVLDNIIIKYQQMIEKNSAKYPDLALLQMKAFDSSVVDHYKIKNGDELNFDLLWPSVLIYSYEDFLEPFYKPLPVVKDYHNLIIKNLFFHQHLNELIKIREMYKHELIKLKIANDNSFAISIDEIDKIGYEYFEMEDYLLSKNNIEIKRNPKREMSIKRHMDNKVRVFNKKYIAYTTNKKIDDYYRLLALKFTKGFYGKSAFDSEAKFNGIAFNKYVESIELLTSIALKHFDYCMLLIKKEPYIKWFDILTVNKSISDEIETLMIGLNIAHDDAKKIIELLIFTRSDLEKCINKKAVPPIFIRLTSNMLARSTLSLISGSSYMYLLTQLQSRFPEDWSREQPKLEIVFRKEICDIFLLRKKCICLESNINLNMNKRRITDVDTVIIDNLSNTILLFQLKWQEPFGQSIQERESKKRNFLNTSEKWLIDVKKWLSDSTDKEKADAFRVKPSLMQKAWKFKFFIIGRYFSRFSYKTYGDETTTWCNWYRFKALAEKIDINTPNYFDELSYQIDKSYENQKKNLNMECEKIYVEDSILDI